MELRHLRYFTTVAEELNITRAAARLHVSQPPLSRQIRDLEDELGVTLLDRSPKQVRLTAAGRVFFKEARKVLHAADLAACRARAATGEKADELHVGYAPSPTAEILPRALQSFRKAMPRTRVVLLDMSTDDMVDGVADRTLDLALLVNTPRRAWRTVVFEKLLEFPIGAVVPRKHPLARRRSVTLDEVLALPIVAYIHKGYSDYHQFLAATLKHSRVKPRIFPDSDGVTSLIAAIVSGRGIALGLPTFAGVSGGRVKFVPISPAIPPVDVGIVVRKGRLSPAIESFVAIVRSAAGMK
jgi:DNA-binding transcriptional LysR family regulator